MSAIDIIAEQLVLEHAILSRQYNTTLAQKPGAYGTLEELRFRLRDMEASMVDLLRSSNTKESA